MNATDVLNPTTRAEAFQSEGPTPMSTAETNPVVADRFLDNTCPDSHVELSRHARDHLAREGISADNAVKMDLIRKRHPSVYRSIQRASFDDVSLQVLMVLVANSGTTTYRELGEWVEGASERTIRRRVWDLRDEDLLVVDGRPALICFASEVVEILAADVVEMERRAIEEQQRQSTREKDVTSNTTTTENNSHTQLELLDFCSRSKLDVVVETEVVQNRSDDREPGSETEQTSLSEVVDRLPRADTPTRGGGTKRDVSGGDPYANYEDAWAHVEVGDPGHPVEFTPASRLRSDGSATDG